jgi:hypothetical protein
VTLLRKPGDDSAALAIPQSHKLVASFRSMQASNTTSRNLFDTQDKLSQLPIGFALAFVFLLHFLPGTAITQGQGVVGLYSGLPSSSKVERRYPVIISRISDGMLLRLVRFVARSSRACRRVVTVMMTGRCCVSLLKIPIANDTCWLLWCSSARCYAACCLLDISRVTGDDCDELAWSHLLVMIDRLDILNARKRSPNAGADI